jgi:hypothetical protein
MPTFSRRLGIEPERAVLQVTSMDESLRMSLWSALSESYLNDLPKTSGQSVLHKVAGYNSIASLARKDTDLESSKIARVFKAFWTDYLRRDVNDLSTMNPLST